MESTFENEIAVCECGDVRHQLIFTHDEQDKTVYASVHLTKLSFWKRLKYGIQYIFGYQSKYGAFEESSLGPKHLVAFKHVVKTLEGL